MRVLGIIWVFSVIVSFAARADDAVADPQPTATAPASDAASTPTPASDQAASSSGTSTTAAPAEKATAAAAASLLGPPSGLQMTYSYSLFTGAQTDAALWYAQSSVTVGFNYKLHPKVFASGSLSPYLDMTPNPQGNRRLDMQRGSTFARLNFRNLYKEENTGIRVGGNLTYQIPLSLDDLLPGNRRYGQLGGAVQLFRPTGDWTFALSGGAAVPFFKYAAAVRACDPVANAAKGVGCPAAETPVLVYNVMYSTNVAATAIWGAGSWSVFAQFGLNRAVLHSDLPALNPTTGLLPTDTRYGFSAVAQLAYSFNEHLSANFGFFNAGPQIDDRQGFNNFLFDKTLAAFFTGFDWVE